jgi:hypothetical protein
VPAVPFAVNDTEVATPAELVVAVFTPPAKLPLAPLAGAVNVTVAPETGFPKESFTVAWKGLANAVLMAVVCGVPPVAVIDAGAPAVLVRAKPGFVINVPTPAVTV